MTIDEAIQHCKEQVQEQAKKGCYSCAEEHQQLAEWLKELKAYKEEAQGMKLIIDIPEHIYEHAKEGSEDSRDEGEAMRAIANGTQQESSSEIPNTCGDAISRQAVLDAFWKLNIELSPTAIWTIQNMVKDVPSVTPQQRTGMWIEHFDEIGKWYECDQCHTDWGGSVNYCPNCGAKMEVEE